MKLVYNYIIIKMFLSTQFGTIIPSFWICQVCFARRHDRWNGMSYDNNKHCQVPVRVITFQWKHRKHLSHCLCFNFLVFKVFLEVYRLSNRLKIYPQVVPIRSSAKILSGCPTDADKYISSGKRPIDLWLLCLWIHHLYMSLSLAGCLCLQKPSLNVFVFG